MRTSLSHRLWLILTPGGLSALLGIWLFVSAFVLPQTFDERFVTTIFGILIFATGVSELRIAEGPYLERFLAVLLGISVVILPRASVATAVNDACVALAVFVLSMLRSGGHGRFVRLHAR
jgi:hypothetical protein